MAIELLETTFGDYKEDEKRLIDVPLILHELRSFLNTSTNSSQSKVLYHYTSETGKSARFCIINSEFGVHKVCKKQQIISLRVDLITHVCKLLNGRCVYETFDNLADFAEYYNEHIAVLFDLIGKV